MSKELKNGKDKDGIIRPGAALNQIFDKNLVWLFIIGTIIGVIMSGLIYS